MLVVMFNNRSYYQDVGHQTAITKIRQRPLDQVGVGVNLDRPATDFAMLARSFNLYGDGPILDAEAIRQALARGLKVVKEEKARPHRYHYATPLTRNTAYSGGAYRARLMLAKNARAWASGAPIRLSTLWISLSQDSESVVGYFGDMGH